MADRVGSGGSAARPAAASTPGSPEPSRRGDAANARNSGARPSHKSTSGRSRLRTVEEISAGGLVVKTVGADTYGVLIGRRDASGRLRWLLPKGHVEPGESIPDTAIREVREETGISAEVVARIGAIRYWFTAPDRRVHKTVHHFVLRATGGELSTRDIEVDEVEWVPLAAIPARLSFADERELADKVPGILAGQPSPGPG
jgi:8-oxo-dGTP pyrophosphatase MutT (NUDIX family)